MKRAVLLAAFVSACVATFAAPMPPGIDPNATYSGSFAFVRPPGVDAAAWQEVLREMARQLQGMGASGDTAISQNEMIVRFRNVPGSTLPDIYNLPNVRVSSLTKDPKAEPDEEPPPPPPTAPPPAPATQPWTGNGPLTEEGVRGIPVKNTSGPFYDEGNQPTPPTADSPARPTVRPAAPASQGYGNGPLPDEDTRLKPAENPGGTPKGGRGSSASSPPQGIPVEYTNGPFVKDPPKPPPATDREQSVEGYWAAPTNVWDRNSSAYGDGSRIIYVKLKGKAQPQRMRFDVAKQLGYLPAGLAPGDVPEKEP